MSTVSVKCPACAWMTKRVYVLVDDLPLITTRAAGFGRCAKCGGPLERFRPEPRRPRPRAAVTP